jgi:S-adenosylmethionine uptake transporter
MTLGMSAPRSLTLLAFLMACLGVALFSVMDAVMKGLVLSIGVYNALLWRNLAGVLMSGSVYAVSRRGWPSRAAMRIHILRGVVVAAMALLFFWSLAHLPLAEAIALSFIAPLIALYLAAVMLGETIGKAAIFASIMGIAGVAVIMAGKFGSGDYSADAMNGALAVFASAVLFAYNLILARQQAQIAEPAEIAFFQVLTVALVLACGAPWFAVVPQGLVQWLPLVGAAALAIVSLLLLSWAYARAEAQVLIPVEYTAFIWAAILGWMVFDEALSWTTVAGTVMIVAGCLTVARAQKNPQPMQVEETVA